MAHNDDLPEFASATYTSSSFGMDALGGVGVAGSVGVGGNIVTTGSTSAPVRGLMPAIPGSPRRHQVAQAQAGEFVPKHFMDQVQQARVNLQQQQEFPMVMRRLVQVFVADTNEHVPLKDCLLYQGEVQLTDLTDQELFYEIPIKQLLTDHNVKRITMIDKSVKERTQHLEPARVRDLRMTVVTIAQF